MAQLSGGEQHRCRLQALKSETTPLHNLAYTSSGSIWDGGVFVALIIGRSHERVQHRQRCFNKIIRMDRDLNQQALFNHVSRPVQNRVCLLRNNTNVIKSRV
ncbi:hypothetical protein HBI56_030180 [Parastagonospora nodorum]|uniref:Uncharacterized protein n=1 Tax=Phaeosphaeria nodorum (strain SN15 / ATCC MYA-4574 / FGSC 10173) TaxID=321614 RepID=A0A7U2EY79_PHANO|nr:hypothetical protein HBH56_017790 [Parastagonospora nodorum]QRC95215.1 hypothetical protein JI435_407050 [Parastagonospora nodorum SN15]KAH3937056.1 hypothetical protein HBH54_016700 [Parastagonospora nodorum]KAH3953669.1 hypothetical protein HBH53_028800 [Parastagonospora nodorum]KAH3962577.1 hypothetical protein HBH51_172930 [Parastagonospora nodorum]